MTSSEDRAADRAAELQMLLIREAASLAVMCVVLLLMRPRTQMWVAEQKHRFRRRRAQEIHEAKMVAEFQRELSRDLPLVERGQVEL